MCGKTSTKEEKNMKTGSLKILALTVVIAVLIVPAAHGTPTPNPGNVVLAQTDLLTAYARPTPNPRNLVLAGADLPAGFRQTASKPVDNRELAKLLGTLVDTPDTWLSRLETWQRTGGHRAEFLKQTRGPAGVTQSYMVFSEVNTFRSVSGARAAFAAFHRINRSEELTRRHFAAGGIRLLNLETRKAERLGDEGHLYLSRFSFTQPVPGQGQSASTLWRRGSVLGSVTWMAIHSSVFEADVMRLSSTQDRRIRGAVR
jgi:hypothetical protein